MTKLAGRLVVNRSQYHWLSRILIRWYVYIPLHCAFLGNSVMWNLFSGGPTRLKLGRGMTQRLRTERLLNSRVVMWKGLHGKCKAWLHNVWRNELTVVKIEIALIHMPCKQDSADMRLSVRQHHVKSSVHLLGWLKKVGSTRCAMMMTSII